jgi:carboxymethylenebutenolidase
MARQLYSAKKTPEIAPRFDGPFHYGVKTAPFHSTCWSSLYLPEFKMQKKRLTAQDFDQELLILFDTYVHGFIDRRGFLDKAQKFATLGLTATGLLAALSPDFAMGQQIAPDDSRIKTEWQMVPSPDGYGEIKGYLCRPANAATGARLPAILVVHENRGLSPHIEDVARRLAQDGFMVFAPDALTPLGGYPGNQEKAAAAFAKLDEARTREDFVASANWLQARADSNGKLGVVGFCWGGDMVHLLTTRLPHVDAAVAFYGKAPATTEAIKVRAPLLLHFAGIDDRINSAWPAYEAALTAAGVQFTVYRYPGTQHGFNNDTTPRYDAAAAKLAWDRSLAFFRTRLQAGAPQSSVRIRGTVQSVGANSLIILERQGESVEVALAPQLVVSEVFPVTLADVKPGSFIGTAAMPQADGTQRAIAVMLFPESARGVGEGYRPFDLLPGSSMTNATVATDTVLASAGRKLELKYKGGSQVLVVPPDAPVVSFKAGDRSLLVAGASVSLAVQVLDGRPTATRINAGANGFQLPY